MMPSLRLLSEPVGKSLCNISHSFLMDLVPQGCQTGFMDAAIKNEPECSILCTAY